MTTEPLSKSIQKLQQDLGRRFDFSPMPPMYPQQEPECATCDDMGVIRRREPLLLSNGQKNPDFGKVYPCPNPLCRVANENKMRQLQNLMKNAGVKDKFQKFSFETWDSLAPALKKGKMTARLALEMYTLRNGEAFALSELYTLLPAGQEQERCYEIWKDETMPKHGLILAGINGTGKTGLIASAMLRILQAGQQGLFVNAIEMLSAVMGGYREGNADEIRETIKNTRHLFLDEMTFEATPQHRIELQEITRHRHDKGLPMVITTNMEIHFKEDAPSEFERMYGPQITTGILADCHGIEVGGDVLRHELPQMTALGKAW